MIGWLMDDEGWNYYETYWVKLVMSDGYKYHGCSINMGQWYITWLQVTGSYTKFDT